MNDKIGAAAIMAHPSSDLNVPVHSVPVSPIFGAVWKTKMDSLDNAANQGSRIWLADFHTIRVEQVLKLDSSFCSERDAVFELRIVLSTADYRPVFKVYQGRTWVAYGTGDAWGCHDTMLNNLNASIRSASTEIPEQRAQLFPSLAIQQRICTTRVNERYDIFYYIFEPVRFDEPPPWYCPGCIHLVTTRYFIRNKVTRQCVDARDGAKNDWSIVQQWSCRDKSAPQNARSMVWDSVPGDFYSDGIHSLGITGRSFKLKNFNSGLCLDVRSGSSDEFAQFQQYHCTSNNPAQNFYQAGDPY
jgi:hypothetical protein